MEGDKVGSFISAARIFLKVGGARVNYINSVFIDLASVGTYTPMQITTSEDLILLASFTAQNTSPPRLSCVARWWLANGLVSAVKER